MLDRRESPKLYGAMASWKKHENYEFEEIDGITWIVAKHESPVEEYNPYDKFSDILYDFLLIGWRNIPKELRGRLHQIDYNLDKAALDTATLNKAIMKFVKKYGLLGLCDSIPSSSHGFSYKSYRERVANEVLRERYKSFEQISIVSNEEFKNKPIKILNPPKRVMAEPIPLFLDALEMIFRYAVTWDVFINNKYDWKEEWVPQFEEPLEKGITWNDYFQRFGFSKYNLQQNNLQFKVNLQFDNAWKLYYDSPSLFSTLCFMQLMDITSQHQQVRACIRCQKPYVPKSSKAKYCGDTCGTYMRVKALRYIRNQEKEEVK